MRRLETGEFFFAVFAARGCDESRLRRQHGGESGRCRIYAAAEEHGAYPEDPDQFRTAQKIEQPLAMRGASNRSELLADCVNGVSRGKAALATCCGTPNLACDVDHVDPRRGSVTSARTTSPPTFSIEMRPHARRRSLQLKIHLGEYAAPSAPTTSPAPLMILGNVRPLNLRVDVDETDARRIKAGADAVGFLRGRWTEKIPLKFVRFEPVVVPKRSLTGDTTERVDTRVLQIIYQFEGDAVSAFVGQQMDIFIDASCRLQPAATSASVPLGETAFVSAP